MPVFFFNDTATTEIYTLSLHDALPIWSMAVWVVCVAALTAPASQAIYGATGPCSRWLDLLSRMYSNFYRMEAHFKDSLDAPALNQKVVEEGIVYLEKGAKMRWDYTTPRGKLAVCDGKTSYLYLPSEKQVFVQPVKRGPQAPLAFRLLSGEVDLKRDVVCLGASETGEEVTLSLKLIKGESGIHQLRITLLKASGAITGITYKDSIGNVITLELSMIRKPAHLDQKLFNFTPPGGTTIIRSR